MTSIGAGSGLNQIIALRQQILDRNASLRDLRESDAAGQVGAGSSAAQPGEPAAGGFADTLKSAVSEVNAAQNRSAEMAAAYERGEVTDIAQVMLARQEAGVAFEATLQVRNKLLSAYNDIMRMGA